jgi:hypothetical protein
MATNDEQHAPRSPRQRELIDGTIMELHDTLDQAFSELSQDGGMERDTRLRLQNDLATLINLLRPYRNEPKGDGDPWNEATPFAYPEKMLLEIADGDIVEERPNGRRNADPEPRQKGREFRLELLLESAFDMIDFAHQLGFTPRAEVRTPVANPDPV